MNEKPKSDIFREGHPFADYLLEWWTGLKQNKGDRAGLRRCKNLTDIQIKAPAFPRFYWGALKLFKREERKPGKEQTGRKSGFCA